MNDDHEAARAARMYPGTPAEMSPVDASAANPEPAGDQPAQVQRNDVPPLVAEQRRADMDRRMYGAQALFQYALPDGALGAEIDHKEAREVAMDLGAEHADLQALAGLAREAPTEEQVQAWRAESQEYLRRMQVSTGDLDLARKLVQRDPRLAAWLDATRLGDHPAVVERMISLAKTQAGLGRLR